MSEKTVSLDFPVKYEMDVVVCGGGTGGWTAAVSAARNGVKTLLIEKRTGLGGTMTFGYKQNIHTMRTSRDRHRSFSDIEYNTPQVIRGLGQEVIDRLFDKDAVEAPPEMKGESAYNQPFDPEMFKIEVEDMCLEAGVKLLYETSAIAPIMDGNTIKGVTFINSSGPGAVLAKVVIDSTAFAHIALSAGAEVVPNARTTKGLWQCWTNFSTIGGVRMDDFEAWRENENIDKREFFVNAIKRGKLSLPKGCKNLNLVPMPMPVFRVGGSALPVGSEGGGALMGLRRHDDGVCDFMADCHIYDCNSNDAEQLTEAWIYMRKRAQEVLGFYIRNVPGFENAYMIKTSSQMGIRDTVQIFGDYVLTEEDCMSGKTFDDAICRIGRCLETHPCAPDGFGEDPPFGPLGLGDDFAKNMKSAFSTPHKDNPWWVDLPEGIDSYDVPYRTLLVKGIENLLIACMATSVEGFVIGTTRGEGGVMAFGEAAGTAAAIAVKDDVTVRNVDIKKLQTQLVKQGVDLGSEERLRELGIA